MGYMDVDHQPTSLLLHPLDGLLGSSQHPLCVDGVTTILNAQLFRD